MGRKTIDLAGQRFGRLVAIERDYSRTGGHAYWTCHCDCGQICQAGSNALRTGYTSSCGCLFREGVTARNQKARVIPYSTAKGKITKPRTTTRTPGYIRTYQCWYAMIDRCTNPGHPAYPRYGGRGITVCERWRSSFANFLADMGERPEHLTIERIDNGRGYEPDNCCWITKAAQTRNRRPRAAGSH